MSFGGSVQAMITSLKNNARHRKTVFEKKDIFHDSHVGKKVYLIENKMTPEQKEKLIKQLKAEKKKGDIKRLIALTIALAITIIALLKFYKSTN